MSASEPDEFSGPLNFGRYTLLARLGQGGMADALLAMLHGDLGFQKLVVVKRMHATLARDPHFVKMFLDEARLAARLNHPNVVATSEVGEVDGQYFIAMEYLEGLSLDRIVRRYLQHQRGIPIGILLRIVCDALEGLHHAHELRDFDGRHLEVVHRDVTPSNLFVTYDGLSKVLDFGIAKAALQDENTRTGMLKGKLAYMSPDQFYTDPIDRRSDIWSVGVMLWEMITGRRLFKGSNDAQTYQNIMALPIPSVVDYRAEAPDTIDPIIRRALERTRAQRYPDAEALRRDLEAVLRTFDPPTSRADVATEMRSTFGDLLESNRHAIRSFATPGVSPPSGLSATGDGELKPGGGLTIPPTASTVDARDIAPKPVVRSFAGEESGEPTQVTSAAQFQSQTSGAWQSETLTDPTHDLGSLAIQPDASTAATTIERIDSLPASLWAPVTPARPPTVAATPWVAPQPPQPAWSPSGYEQVGPSLSTAPFDPLPPEIVEARRRDAARAQRRQSIERALGWVIVVALLVGGALAVASQRATIARMVESMTHERPPDPALQGSFRLYIESTPTGARVFEGAEELGRTPLQMMVQRAQAAQHPRQFTLRVPGYNDTRTVQNNTLQPAVVLRVTLPPSNPRAPNAQTPHVAPPPPRR